MQTWAFRCGSAEPLRSGNEGCGRRRLRPPRNGQDGERAGAAGRALAIDTHTLEKKDIPLLGLVKLTLEAATRLFPKWCGILK